MNPAQMLLDGFISRFLRMKSKQYLTFERHAGLVPAPAPNRPIHLYVHIPFCSQLCPYCSFHRVAFQESQARAYFQALRTELELYHGLGYGFSGVYFGGGTPTILMDELLATLDLTNRLFHPKDISVETNPDRLEPDLLRSLAASGVGRVSVGVQSFDSAVLKTIGRYEKYGNPAVLQERIAKALGIVHTLNIDMIYNFPAQSKASLQGDIAILNSLAPDQITFYPLMISHATLQDMTRIMGRHSYAKERQFYEIIVHELEPAYQRASAWCFSKSQGMIDEYIVQENEYVGAGSGAFGLVAGSIYANTFSIPEYISELAHGRIPIQARKVFSKKELARYIFLMDLFGLTLDKARFKARFGQDLALALPLEYLFFTAIGALSTKAGQVHLTRSGMYYWVIMMREFFTGVDNFRDLSRQCMDLTAGDGA